MYKSHSIPVERSAHYYTLGTPSPAIKNLWIVCHGYGQLASRVIQKFTEIADDTTLVIAPEGLSRFYWNGVTGQVAASWMTSKDRLEEIADYTRFIKSIYEKYTAQLSKEVKITLFGFSQGCATQCRWIMREFPIFDHLVLWGGRLPEDLDYRPYQKYFDARKIYFVYGLKDQFINPAFVEWQRGFALEQKIAYETITFDGKHEIDREVLMDLYHSLKA